MVDPKPRLKRCYLSEPDTARFLGISIRTLGKHSTYADRLARSGPETLAREGGHAMTKLGPQLELTQIPFPRNLAHKAALSQTGL